ncbi:plasma membrane calcium [Chytridiales sp. JEL 0842]|nr:plasma membrane calcium [Chytridiales sp. JEL 0842]
MSSDDHLNPNTAANANGSSIPPPSPVPSGTGTFASMLNIDHLGQPSSGTSIGGARSDASFISDDGATNTNTSNLNLGETYVNHQKGSAAGVPAGEMPEVVVTTTEDVPAGGAAKKATGGNLTVPASPSKKAPSTTSKVSREERTNADGSFPVFGVTPDEINGLLDPKSPENLIALGAQRGLLRRLRTDATNGLSVNRESRVNAGAGWKRPVGSDGLPVGGPQKPHKEGLFVPGPGSAQQPAHQLLTDDERTNVNSEPSEDSDSGTDDEGDAPAAPAADPDAARKAQLMNNTDPELFKTRLQLWGDNTLPQPELRSFWSFAFDALQDKMLMILIFAAAAEIGIGIYKTWFAAERDSVAIIDGAAIITAVIIIVMTAAVNDYRKQGQFRALNDFSRSLSKAQVVRDGQTLQIPTSALLVGDIVNLQAGDVIPADGVLLQGFDVSADESSLTGESVAVKKNLTQDPFLLSGTKIVTGMGRMVVVATGIQSLNGRLMAALKVEDEGTPLQAKLGRLADVIAYFGGGFSLGLVILLVILYFTSGVSRNAVNTANDMLLIFIVGITLIVVAVPEGLPLAVTLALSYATIRMLKDNNLVRHLKACETMGNATTVCSDKTGTLTQNKMSVVAGRLAGRTFGRIEGGGGAAEVTPDLSGLPPAIKNLILRSINVNTTADEMAETEAPAGASVENPNDKKQKKKKNTDPGAFKKNEKNFIGSKTEVALLEFTDALGRPYKADRTAAEVFSVIPFSSERKRMSTVVRVPKRERAIETVLFPSTAMEAQSSSESLQVANLNGTKKVRQERGWLYCKGAAEIVLGCCDRYIDSNGVAQPLDAATKKSYEALIVEMAENALRTIAIGIKPVTPKKKEEGESSENAKEDDEYGLILAGIVGIQDPIRPEVPGAIAACHRAGIVVRMVTGDNLATAKSIAKLAGLLTSADDIVMDGPTFRNLTQESMDQVLPKLRVLARSSPMDKQILVNNLKRLGETVAVTGDGTNDAPALKSADVGFSMGIAGTEVAKEASDIVLLDDNFVSLSKAIMWGRSVYDSVRKFLQFQLTVNVSAVGITFASSIMTSLLTPNRKPDSALSAVQLLWVNLIMDTFAALALATDPPTPEVLDRPPARKSDSLINFDMWKMIVIQGIYQIIVCLILYVDYTGLRATGSMDLESRLPNGDPNGYLVGAMVFNTFVFCQLFNEINCRVIGREFNIFKGIEKNHIFTVIWVGTVIVQAIIVQFGSAVFKCTPLTAAQWGICVGVGAGAIPVGILVRLVPNSLFGIKEPEMTQIGIDARRIEAEKAAAAAAGVAPSAVVVKEEKVTSA